jgi:hemerythrin-like domain-containing protein
MNIIAMLSAEHRQIGVLMGELSRHLEKDGLLEREEAKAAARTLVNALTRHERIEDRVLYRHLLDRGAIPPEILGIFQDGHRKVHFLLGKFVKALRGGGDSLRYGAGMEFLEALREHFDEEEKLLFSWVNKTLPAEELEEMAERICETSRA